MSFNAKNLSYEANEPTFLRKLRNEHGGGDSARHERPLARPRKQMKDDVEDDQPTYVVEDGRETLSKDEYEALLKESQEEKHDEENPSSLMHENDAIQSNANLTSEKDPSDDKVVSSKEHVAAIGASNKRRVANVVGDDEETPLQGGSEVHSTKPRAKKMKKVKLSFDEDAEIQ